MGTYQTELDLHVFDLRGRFDVLLGKGWHDAADPQISWRHNMVQVLQDGNVAADAFSRRPDLFAIGVTRSSSLTPSWRTSGRRMPLIGLATAVRGPSRLCCAA